MYWRHACCRSSKTWLRNDYGQWDHVGLLSFRSDFAFGYFPIQFSIVRLWGAGLPVGQLLIQIPGKYWYLCAIRVSMIWVNWLNCSLRYDVFTGHSILSFWTCHLEPNRICPRAQASIWSCSQGRIGNVVRLILVLGLGLLTSMFVNISPGERRNFVACVQLISINLQELNSF